MKKIIFILSILLNVTNIFALEKQIIREDENQYHIAETLFENLKYGDSLKACENALIFRRNLIQKDVELLQTAISAKKVQRAGDDINKVIPILQNRGETRAIDIINYYINKKGEEFFENSISKLISYIKSIEEYPEVLKLMGDIYKIEGEYEFSEKYYLQAYENKEVLDIPDEKYEILYLLAELSELKGDKELTETRYLNIVAEDSFFTNKHLLESMNSTISGNKKESMEKFFQLYRASNYNSLNAYHYLVNYYLKAGENKKALEISALSVITGFTKIESIIKKRDILFNYEDLGSLLFQVQYYEDIKQWGIENNIWDDFLTLAEITYELDYKNFSIELYKVLAQYSPDEYYQKKAVLKLDSSL